MLMDMKSSQASASVREIEATTSTHVASEVSGRVVDQVITQDATEDSDGNTTVLHVDINE